MRNVREAQRIFRSLGFRILAFGENEPSTRNALGFNLVAAGSELIKLSEFYPRPKPIAPTFKIKTAWRD